MKKLLIGVVLATSIAGCSTATPPTSSSTKQDSTGYSVSKNIGSGSGQTYYLIKNNGTWNASKTGNLSESNVERVSVSSDRIITLQANSASNADASEKGHFCMYGTVSLFKYKKDGDHYDACDSAFTKVIVPETSELAGYAFVKMLSLVFLVGTDLEHVEVDRGKLFEVAQTSGLIAMVEQDRQEAIAAAAKREQEAAATRQKAEQERLAADQQTEQGNANAKYQRGLFYLGAASFNADAEKWFEKAATAGSADALYKLGMFQKEHYSNATEMERLWNKAAKGGNVAAQAELKKLTDAREQLAREREQQAQQAKDEAARQAKEAQQLASFRKSIHEGDASNCGPVIEIKGNLIKIAYAVANYGNEHWIRRDQVFPSGYGCRFYNGQYQSPL